MPNSTKVPEGLNHKPVVTVDYEQLDEYKDVKYLSLGRATWDNEHTFSAKCWRCTDNNRWSPQSEEISFKRLLDLTIFLVSFMKSDRQFTSWDVQDEQSLGALKKYIDDNSTVLNQKLTQLKQPL